MKSKLIFFGSILLLVLLWRFAVNNSALHNELGERQQGTYVDLSAEEALALLQENKETFLVDVHIPEQEHLVETDAFIPFEEVDGRLDEFPEDKETPILVYCRSGNMSKTVSEELVELGYGSVYNLAGGLHAWRGAGILIDWNQLSNSDTMEEK